MLLFLDAAFCPALFLNSDLPFYQSVLCIHKANMEEAGEEENKGDGEQQDEGTGEQEKNNEHPQTAQFICTTCGAKFSRKYNRDRHFQLSHNNIARVYDCRLCGAVLDSAAKLQEHRKNHEPTTGFQVVNSAFRKKCVLYRKTYTEKMLTLENAFNADKEDLLKLIQYEVGVRRSMRMGLIYHAEFARVSPQFGGAADNIPQAAEEADNNLPSTSADNNLPSTSAYQQTPVSSSDEEEEERERETLGERQKRGEKGKKRKMRKSHFDDAIDVSTTDTESDNNNEGDESEMDNTDHSENEGNTEDNSRENDNTEHVEEEVYEVCLRAPSSSVIQTSDFGQILNNARQFMQNRIDDFVENGSGWRLNQIICADLEIGTCAALNGSCNLVSLKYLKSMDNIKISRDIQKCFLYAISSYFTNSINVVKLKKFIEKHLVVTIPSPVNIAHISKFENDNSHLDFKINVIFEEFWQIYPIHFSKRTSAKHIITLLLYKTLVNGKLVNHYCLVPDVENLLKKKYLCVSGKASYQRSVTCLNCFTKYSAQGNGPKNLQKHYENCIKNKPQAIGIPQPGDVIKFENFAKQFESYFVGFFDFESKHVKEKYECAKCKKVDEEDATICPHKTFVKAVQVPITYSYIILDKYGKVVFHNTYTGKHCAKKFIKELIAIEPTLLEVLSRNEEINMSQQDEESYRAATDCHICGEKMLWSNKVRDHCHITGKYLGAAHKFCNLLRSERKTIPLFAHNLTGYDGHFIIKNAGKVGGITNFRALPYNTEKFRCIELNSYQIKDSLSFLNASLGELMNDLLKNKANTFSIIDQLKLYDKKDTTRKLMILQKGIYPYEYCTSIKKLRQTKHIPEKHHFYSALTNTNVSDADYEHAKKVFAAFNCKDMICYTELYCSIDVGILAEVVMQFRRLVLKNFGLDCTNYISTPQLAFDCMLKSTKVQMELLTDVDMILMVEQNIRGGVSYINQRHCVEKVTENGETQILYVDGE